MTKDLLERLRISLPRPRRGYGTEIDAALVLQVLGVVATRLHVVPGETPVSDALRQQVIRSACRQLVVQGALEEALFLNTQARFDMGTAEFELRVVRMLDDSRRTADTLRRLGDSIPRAWATQVSLLESRLKMARGRQRERISPVYRSLMLKPLHHRIFGPLHSRVEDQLACLPVERFANPTLERLIGALIRLRRIPVNDAAEFRRRFLWGRAAKLFLEYLARMTVEFSRQQPSGEPTGTLAQALLGLARQVNERVLVTDIGALEQVLREGRSVLGSQAHAGVNHFWKGLLEPLAVKSIVFAASPRANGRGEFTQMLSTSGNGAQLGFLKAAKAVRHGQHLIRIFPDGSAGGERATGTVLGMPATIGAGAARLAWLAGAATFFLGSRWRDDGSLEVYAAPGPVADRGIGQETFESAFTEFFFARLNEIANGAPENMGGPGGIWAALMRSGTEAVGDAA